MKKLLLAIGLMSFVSTLSYAESLSFNARFEVADHYNIEDDQFQGDYLTMSINSSLVLKSDSGQVVKSSTDTMGPMNDSIRTAKMEIVGENKVKLVVGNADIDAVIPADIKKSGDELVSLTIASEDIFPLWEELYKQEGLALLSLNGIKVNVNRENVNVSLTASDVVCSKVESHLVCKYSFNVMVTSEQ